MTAPEGYRFGPSAEVEYWLADPETVLLPGESLGVDGWVIYNPAMVRIMERRAEIEAEQVAANEPAETP